MALVPTIKIRHPKDARRFMVINKTDFDAAKHELWGSVKNIQAAPEHAEEEHVPDNKLEDIDSMKKHELHAYAQDRFGVRLDKRKSLAKLKKELQLMTQAP